MPHGTEVGLGPGDFVFDGDPATPRKKWHTHPHPICYKSSAVAEMGDRGQSRRGPKTGGCAPFAVELGRRLTQCGLDRGLLPYQVASSSI